jgi:hypothetical protein
MAAGLQLEQFHCALHRLGKRPKENKAQPALFRKAPT